MKLHVGNRNFFRKFTAIALSLLLCQPTYSQSSENQQIVFEGSLTDTSGNPISLAGVSLDFYITANGCYLYGESSLTSGDSQGNILHRIGGGSVIGGSPNTFSQNLLFGSVTGTTTFAGNNCSVTASDTRLAQVYYAAQNISATIKMGTVPYAQNATTLAGKSAADFVLTSADTTTLFSGGTAGQYLTKSVSGLTWTSTNLSASQITSALGYTPASTTTTLNASSITTALGYTPASSASLSAYAVRANNLSDVSSATAARTNLGLGSLATKNSVNLATAEVTGTLPATNLPAYSGDISKAAGSASATVQGLRGVTLSATAPVSGQVLYFNGSAWMPITIPSNVGTVTNVTSANSDISVSSGASTPILTLNSGSGSNQIVKLDASARLPSVDGSQVTALNAANITSGILPTGRLPSFTGDATTAAGSNTMTVSRLRGVNISATAPVSGQVLLYNGVAWTPITIPSNVGTVTNITAGTGLLGGSITSAGTLSVSFGQVSGTVAAGNDSRITGALQSVNNLADLGSSATARANLGLGGLATKTFVNLASDVSGVLPIANGGSLWTQSAGGIYNTSMTTVGSSTIYSNVGLTVLAPKPVSNSIIASLNNDNPDGFGLKINVDNTNSAYYGLKVSALNLTTFVVRNDGNIGVGTGSPTARLHLAGGSSTLAPLRLSSGTINSTPVAGAIENDGSYLYYTDDANVRRRINTGLTANAIDNIANINSTTNISLNPVGSVVVSSTLPSTNFQTGALVVKGGIGVNGAGNFTGSLNSSGTITAAGQITASGNITTGASVNAANVISPNIFGSSTASGTLILESTSHATKGHIQIAPNGGNVGVGTVSPAYRFTVRAPSANSFASVITPSAQSSFLGFGEDSSNQLFSSYYDAVGTQRILFIASGTNYINNTLVVGAVAETPGSKLTVQGNSSLHGNVAVSKTLHLGGAGTSSVPLQFTGTALSATLYPGAIEYDGSNLFFTNAITQRRRVAGGIASGTIDNMNKLSYNSGNLTVEGNTTGSNPAVTINNLGAGAVALQVNDSAVVSGSIKLSGDGSNADTVCTGAEEGKQRYNSVHKAMEVCDGAYWNGINGLTHCESPTTGYGAGVSYTLIGKAGTGSAFCMGKQAEYNDYLDAVDDCTSRIATNGSRMGLCAEADYLSACKQYTAFGANAESKLPGFKAILYWTNTIYSISSPPYYSMIGFTFGVANACSILNKDEDAFLESSSRNYRCCYQ